MKKLLVILICLIPLVGVGQYMKAPTHYDAQIAADNIIKGHLITNTSVITNSRTTYLPLIIITFIPLLEF